LLNEKRKRRRYFIFLAPLHCAARSGHDQVVDLLLENGAPFGAKTKNGLSALHMGRYNNYLLLFLLMKFILSFSCPRRSC